MALSSVKTDLFAIHPKAMDYTTGHRIEPLIGGKQTFAAIEKAIEEAQSTVHMAYWTFDPAVTTSPDIEAQTLADLIRRIIQRGVSVRLVIADFDPIIGTLFHGDSWAAYRKLAAIAEGLDAQSAARLSVMCSRHDTRWGPVARGAAMPIIRYKLAEKIEAINAIAEPDERRERLGNLPGLWPYIHFDGETAKARASAFPGFFPAAHHEKLCVIDDRIVFLGGLDIDTKRQDGWDHDNDFPWHDVACRLEGPVASFFAHHFRCRWNEEREESQKFLDQAVAPPKIAPLPAERRLPELPTRIKSDDEDKGDLEVKPLRTMSKQRRSHFSRSPISQITEIRDAYLEIIAGAEKFLYIENQYIRSTEIAEALARRAREQKRLELILLLPLMPEDAFVEDEPNIATRHGQYLREKNTDLIFEAFGERVGIFSMQMPRDDKLPDPERAEPEEIIENTVYIHAKTMVCDDKTAIIGSANLNGRSLLTDTETAIAWRGEKSVRDYRLKLWKHALDLDTSDWDTDYLARWKSIAKKNAEEDAASRQGFIIPLPRRHLDAHAKYSWIVPDELV